MTHPQYLKDKARQMRIEKGLTLDEIAERLALGKTTVWYWISDLPIGPTERQSEARRRASLANQLRAKRRRDEAYGRGLAEFFELETEPTFREFVCMYIAEGYKRNRNTVAIANSDPAVIRLSDPWIRSFSRNPVTYHLQYHADQDLDELRRFWGSQLGVAPQSIHVQRKSNSSQLARRTWRSVHGVLTIRACDTMFRARLQGWIDRICEEWG